MPLVFNQGAAIPGRGSAALRPGQIVELVRTERGELVFGAAAEDSAAALYIVVSGADRPGARMLVHPGPVVVPGARSGPLAYLGAGGWGTDTGLRVVGSALPTGDAWVFDGRAYTPPGAFGLGRSGWAQYNDSEHTQGSPQALTTTRSQFTVDGDTVLGDYRAGAANWVDDKIRPGQVGEAYMLRIDATVETTNNNADLIVDIDIGSDPFGGSSIVITERTVRLARGTGIPHPFSITAGLYCLDTFLANGGAIGLTASHNSSIYGKRVVLFRVH